MAIAFLFDDMVETCLFNNFHDFFIVIIEEYGDLKKTPKIILNAHNANKYDNHFLRYSLINDFHLPVNNQYLRQADEEGNKHAVKQRDLSKEDRQSGLILEKRVKSQNNLALIFFLSGIRFETEDNWMKTNTSIKQLGYKLLSKGVITEDLLKKDATFDYVQYNSESDLSEHQVKQKQQQIFQELSDNQLRYIRNDVLILIFSYLYYSDIFEGFDYDRLTFTSNILDAYNTSDLTSFQLLNAIKKEKKTYQEDFTDYFFCGENFYDYLKPFYRGGLNFYNQKYLDKIVYDPCFSIDINSSYPYAMHWFKIPTFLKSMQEYTVPTSIEMTLSDDTYTLYRMTKADFDREVIMGIKSRVLRQMLVKYYTTTSEYININSYTIRLVNHFLGQPIKKLTVLSTVTYDTAYFGSRDIISDFYYTKTQGKLDKKVDYKTPYDIRVTEEKNTEQFTPEGVAIAKVNLNGLYGIPALRPYFNLFRLVGDHYKNFINGFSNSQRNIVFSIFVTSVSLYNLLSPLFDVPHDLIDDGFIYADTDSLYLKQVLHPFIPEEIYHPLHLGKWDVENKKIDKIYVQNHKKYVYEVDGTIKIRSAGIPNNAFDKNMSFEEFVSTQFSPGRYIKNTKSILTKQGQIAIYDSRTVLQKGYGYSLFAEDGWRDGQVSDMLESIRQTNHFAYDDSDHVLYVESQFGTFSQRDIYETPHDKDDKRHIKHLQLSHQMLKQKLTKQKNIT